MRCCILDSSRVMFTLLKVVSVSTPSEFICSCSVYGWLMIFSISSLLGIATFGDLDWDLVLASISDLSGGAFCFSGNKEQAISLPLRLFLEYPPQSFQSQQNRCLGSASRLQDLFFFWGTFSSNALLFRNNDIFFTVGLE